MRKVRKEKKRKRKEKEEKKRKEKKESSLAMIGAEDLLKRVFFFGSFSF